MRLSLPPARWDDRRGLATRGVLATTPPALGSPPRCCPSFPGEARDVLRGAHRRRPGGDGDRLESEVWAGVSARAPRGSRRPGPRPPGCLTARCGTPASPPTLGIARELRPGR